MKKVGLEANDMVVNFVGDLPQDVRRDPPEVFDELGSRPDYLQACDLSRLRDQLSADKTRSALMLTCQQHRMTLEAAWSWIEQELPTRKRLCIHVREDEGVGLEVLQTLAKQQREEPAVVLVEIKREHRFLRALLDSESTRIENLVRKLDTVSVTLVFAVPSSLLGREHDDGFWQSSPIQHLKVDWLWQLLRRSFDPERASALEGRLADQRRRGKWSPSLAEVCDEVSRLLALSPAALEQAIAQKDEAQPESLELGEALPAERGIEHYALAVAVFLERLSYPVFEQVLLRVVADETVQDERESLQLQDGVARSVREEIRRDLAEVWKEDPDGVLRRAGLENATAKKRGIRLARPGIRQEIREQLLRSHPKVFSDLITKLAQPDFALSVDLPREFLSELVTLVIEHEEVGAASFDLEWLEDALGWAVETLAREPRLPLQPRPLGFSGPDLGTVRSKLWQTVPRRFAGILDAIVDSEGRRGLVEAWLLRAPTPMQEEAKDGSTEDAILLEVVLELCRFGRFGWLPWLRPFVERGTPRVARTLGRILGNWALDPRVRAWDVLDPVAEWLGIEVQARSDHHDDPSEPRTEDGNTADLRPGSDDESGGDSSPGAAGRGWAGGLWKRGRKVLGSGGPRTTPPRIAGSADSTAFEVAERLFEVASHDAMRYRFVSNRHECPLFRDLLFDPTSPRTRARLESLVLWLQRAQQSAARQAQQDEAPETYRKAAEALLSWTFVVEGVDLGGSPRRSLDEVSTQASPVVKILLEIVAQRFGAEQKQGFLDYWHFMGGGFLDLSKTPKFRNQRQLTAGLRRKTRELRRRFKSIDRAHRRAAKPPRRPRRAKNP